MEKHVSEDAMGNRKNGWQFRCEREVSAQFFEFISLENAADNIRVFHNKTIPELLQTRDYAKIMLRYYPTKNAESDTEFAIRFHRQDALLSETKKFSFLITESVLRQVFGTPEITQRQLLRIKDLAGRPNISIRAIAAEENFDAWQPHPFTLLNFPASHLRENKTEFALSHSRDGQLNSFRSPDESDKTTAECEQYLRKYAGLEEKALSITETLSLIESLTGPTPESFNCWGV
jgi:hypothetical protein